MNIQV